MSTLMKPLLATLFVVWLSACGAPEPATPMTQAEAVSIEDAWIRETPPGAKVSAGYMRLVNAADAPARLIGATLAEAARAEIHTMFMQDGMMRMRQLENGLEIPARGQAALKVGGDHLMLMGLNTALTSGAQLSLQLQFADGSSTNISVPVKPAMGAADSHAHH